MGIFVCAWWLGVEKDDIGTQDRVASGSENEIQAQADTPEGHNNSTLAGGQTSGGDIALTPVASRMSSRSVRSRRECSSSS